MNAKTSYFKNNLIRTKLLLFIDKEIQSKLKQKAKNLKYNCKDIAQIEISFEETFFQKETNKHGHFYSNNHESKINLTSDKTFSTVDNSSIIKEDTHSKKCSNNIICFHNKNYLIKNLSKQSSTLLILPESKHSADYLKTLCNDLKISKKDKIPEKNTRSSVTKSKLLHLSKDKKTPEKINEIKIQKSKKDNQYTYSLFRKSQKQIRLNQKH